MATAILRTPKKSTKTETAKQEHRAVVVTEEEVRDLRELANAIYALYEIFERSNHHNTVATVLSPIVGPLVDLAEKIETRLKGGAA